MGPVPIDVHAFQTFSESYHGSLTCCLSCFGTCRRKIAFSSFQVGTKKNRDKKLRRFVVVSPREVPSLPASCPFKILIFSVVFWRSIPFLCLRPPEKVYTNYFRQPYSMGKLIQPRPTRCVGPSALAIWDDARFEVRSACGPTPNCSVFVKC